jgi:hypothetical protein
MSAQVWPPASRAENPIASALATTNTVALMQTPELLDTVATRAGIDWGSSRRGSSCCLVGLLPPLIAGKHSSRTA